MKRAPPPPPVAPPASPPDAPPPPPADDRRGLECRSCGCADLRVVYTRPTRGNRLMRLRECRHCGRRIPTFEQATE